MRHIGSDKGVKAIIASDVQVEINAVACIMP